MSSTGGWLGGGKAVGRRTVESLGSFLMTAVIKSVVAEGLSGGLVGSGVVESGGLVEGERSVDWDWLMTGHGTDGCAVREMSEGGVSKAVGGLERCGVSGRPFVGTERMDEGVCWRRGGEWLGDRAA